MHVMISLFAESTKNEWKFASISICDSEIFIPHPRYFVNYLKTLKKSLI